MSYLPDTQHPAMAKGPCPLSGLRSLQSPALPLWVGMFPEHPISILPTPSLCESVPQIIQVPFALCHHSALSSNVPFSERPSVIIPSEEHPGPTCLLDGLMYFFTVLSLLHVNTHSAGPHGHHLSTSGLFGAFRKCGHKTRELTLRGPHLGLGLYQTIHMTAGESHPSVRSGWPLMPKCVTVFSSE